MRDGDSQSALSFFLLYHAFARVGGEQAGYGPIAHSLFKTLNLDGKEDIPPNDFWEAFKSKCQQEGTGVNARLNEGVITGLANLANRRGNLFQWVRDEVEATGELRHVFLEVTDSQKVVRLQHSYSR